jgi:hypothetical protein
MVASFPDVGYQRSLRLRRLIGNSLKKKEMNTLQQLV